VKIAHRSGGREPASFLIDTRVTGELPDNQLGTMVREARALTPPGIIDTLGLRRQI